MNFYILLLSVFSNLGLISCKDTFRFASHYADHMVLQRGPDAAVLWGFGEENALVIVSIAGKLIQATAEKGEQICESSLRIFTGKKRSKIYQKYQYGYLGVWYNKSTSAKLRKTYCQNSVLCDRSIISKKHHFLVLK